MNLFQRAWQGLDLAPEERAMLKLLKYTIFSAIITAGTAVLPFISTGEAPNLGRIEIVGFATFAFTILAALDKYATSHGDVALSTVTQTAEKALESRTGVSANVEPIQPPNWLTGPTSFATTPVQRVTPGDIQRMGQKPTG
jgi:hypothetical protein